MDRKEIEKRLARLSRRHSAAFSARMAALALPALAKERSGREEFLWFWRKKDRSRHLLAVLRAIYVAYFFAFFPKIEIAAGVADAAAAAADDAYAAAADAAYSDATASDAVANSSAAYSSADAAYSAYADAAYAAAEDASYSDAAAVNASYSAADASYAYAAYVTAEDASYSDAAAIYLSIIEIELTQVESAIDISSSLQQPLRYVNSNHQQLALSLIEHLRAMGEGFDFWADWYKDRLDGKPVDRAMTEEALMLPDEIAAQGPSSVNAYLKSLFSKKAIRQLNRVRAIFIGHGEAGKTSLIRALHNEDVVEGKEKMTPGVDIREWRVPGSEIKAHFWDFGGQVMAHATHQFFLRERCIYVLLLNARADIQANQQAEYWLEHIRAFGNDAPVLLVGNKSDLAQVNLDLCALTEKYPNICGFYPLSCTRYRDDYRGHFAQFSEAFVNELAKVGMHSIKFEPPHFAVMEAVQDLTGKCDDGKCNAFLAKEAFDDLCKEHGVAKDGELNREWLLDLLDKLGLIIHFPKIHWIDKFVVNPRWLTYGVYSLLYSKSAQDKKGHLTRSDVTKILHNLELQDNLGNKLTFNSGSDCPFIIDAMRQFKLCYLLPDDETLVIPDLLPSDQPASINFDKAGCLTFDFDFEGLLPRHLMSGLIVDRHMDIGENPVWQNGVHLRSRDLKAEALVKADYNARRLILQVSGGHAGRYFSILYDLVKQMLGKMPKLAYTERVRLPGHENHPERGGDFLQLLAMEAEKERDYISVYGRFPLADLLKIMPPDKRDEVRKGQPNIYMDRGATYVHVESLNGGHLSIHNTNVFNQISEFRKELDKYGDKIEIELGENQLASEALNELKMIRQALAVLEQPDDSKNKDDKATAAGKLSRFGDRAKNGASKLIAALKGIKDGGEAVEYIIKTVPKIVSAIAGWG